MIEFDGTLGLGNLSDWVSGIATAIAVIITLFYSQRQARREDEERLHAVYAWAQHHRKVDEWGIEVRNDTHYPIYDWSINVVAPDGTDLLAHLSPLDSSVAILTPGPQNFAWKPPEGFDASESHVQVSITFRDALGIQRTRNHTGRLTRR
ncbi:MAG: hypothetical protein IJO71_08335 [Microbacterium sp.]|jgi:hypothetical protein|uniref:hypothetical protein n=1 Tax=Microbacterium sp. TaxID=51671 RepID=UPI0025F01E00|nr:hypothetical protein [Microbacterium sp.]MBQ9917193.1 hypothetical protein [Microbacterium sp.]MBR2580986.1 hypothetical protein [Cutibacterium sp.]